MFWRWNSEYAYMETQKGEHVSQTEMLSQRLFGLTFWGDYGGDIISRYHYDYIREIAPNITYSISAAHGRGLILHDVLGGNSGELYALISVLAYFDPESNEYGDYPIYMEDSYSDWEYELNNKEMIDGWWGEEAVRGLRDQLGDWENTLIPDHGTDEWANLLWDYEENSGEYLEKYWEGADSLIVSNWDSKEVVNWLLTRYTKELTEAGNPAPLI